jgi:hypothetical protein
MPRLPPHPHFVKRVNARPEGWQGSARRQTGASQVAELRSSAPLQQENQEGPTMRAPPRRLSLKRNVEKLGHTQVSLRTAVVPCLRGGEGRPLIRHGPVLAPTLRGLVQRL